MAISHSNHDSRVTLGSYCARVVFAFAVTMIGLEIAVHYWPCNIARIATCPP
jgi:hypothetical protein